MPAVQTLITAAVGKLAPTRSPGVVLRRLFAPAAGAYTRAGVEPPLEEMLRDPIVRARVRCAGVEPGEVRGLLDEARRRRPPG